MTFMSYATGWQEPSSGWLLQTLKDEQGLYGRLHELTVDEAVSFITGTIFPEANTCQLDKPRRDVMAAVLSREDLTTEHVRQVFNAYRSYSQGKLFRSEFPQWEYFDETLLGLAAVPGCTPSMLGTICRTLQTHAVMRRSVLTEHVTAALLDAENCPFEVVSRIYLHPGDGTRFSSYSYWGDNFHSHVEEHYPDLVGLPDQLLLEVLGSQPIPDAWFVDDWEVGELPTERRRQTNSYIQNGDFLWMDLTEGR